MLARDEADTPLYCLNLTDPVNAACPDCTELLTSRVRHAPGLARHLCCCFAEDLTGVAEADRVGRFSRLHCALPISQDTKGIKTLPYGAARRLEVTQDSDSKAGELADVIQFETTLATMMLKRGNAVITALGFGHSDDEILLPVPHNLNPVNDRRVIFALLQICQQDTGRITSACLCRRLANQSSYEIMGRHEY